MQTTEKYPQDAKKVFRDCGTCSQTFGHILNREFGYPKENEERALDPLAGGLMNQGHQCGMLWGSSLAVGAESFRKYKNRDHAIGIALKATKNVLDSFRDHNNTLNCREITGCDLTTTFGMAKLMFKTIIVGMNNSPCFKMADRWAPFAIESANEGLNTPNNKTPDQSMSCASEVIKSMGGSDEEMVMVAGFGGGLGLSCHACGALAAAIWKKTLAWCEENPGKTPPYLKNPEGKALINTLQEETGGAILCSKITGRTFESVKDHTEYLREGGCAKLIEALATA
jgi:hypothetical protein